MIFFVFVELNFSLLPRKIFVEMQTKTDSNMVGRAHCTVRTAQRGILPAAVNAFLDGRSNVCYTHIDVEQDHYFGSDDCSAAYSSGRSLRAIMHHLQCAGSASV
jgi:hypothetical protein